MPRAKKSTFAEEQQSSITNYFVKRKSGRQSSRPQDKPSVYDAQPSDRPLQKEQQQISSSDAPATLKSEISDTEREELMRLLKAFDLNMEYGPCIGLSRLKRLRRALSLGKRVSRAQELEEFLLRNVDSPANECIWSYL